MPSTGVEVPVSRKQSAVCSYNGIVDVVCHDVDVVGTARVGPSRAVRREWKHELNIEPSSKGEGIVASSRPTPPHSAASAPFSCGRTLPSLL